MQDRINNEETPRHTNSQENSGSIVSEYIVEEKDTLDDLARRYGVSIEEIMAANKETVHDPVDLTRPGQRINIPNKVKD